MSSALLSDALGGDSVLEKKFMRSQLSRQPRRWHVPYVCYRTERAGQGRNNNVGNFQQVVFQETVMRMAISVLVAATAAAATFGCAQKPGTTAAAIEDKVYSVTPDQVQVKAGIVTGDVTELKVTERVEQGTGRVDSAAKLSGKLKLTNSSSDQTVRMISGKILYIDDQGQVIKIEEARTEPVIKFPSSFNSGADRLDPGQDASQSVEVDFPAAALKSKKLKEIRLELAYIPSSYKMQTANFSVSIGDQPASK